MAKTIDTLDLFEEIAVAGNMLQRVSNAVLSQFRVFGAPDAELLKDAREAIERATKALDAFEAIPITGEGAHASNRTVRELLDASAKDTLSRLDDFIKGAS